ncbi:zinc-binding alcohol dehydrogenase family protein [Alteribacter natronophilus]|uniref:zinc-binding alcohol dehydrogenase family protein n=1 Tax=Alteribacter natronophilus TaxID=2583810 RepID=UPI00110F4895|nr:zinc-binding alcohol dehydrogenase family protein [Alteribacter natronophilus]TMW72293.1 zinc-binding alcohol dehydrogenase family protein [Alteribacter natronophilus]
MKAVRVKQAGSLEVVEREKPSVKEPDDVLVKVKMAGICGSDMHIYHGTNPLASYPRIIGHEITGVVEDTGESADRFMPGDKVVLEPIVPCGTCYACRSGRPNVCGELEVFGVHRDGGMQDYLVVKQDNLHRVDTKVPFEEAVLAEPFTIGAQAAFRGQVKEGDTVFIQGAGPIGICCLKIVKRIGAACIISDLSEERLAFARESGADVTIQADKENVTDRVLEHTAGEGANVCIDAVCLPKTFELAVETASIAGRVVVLGFDEEPSSISQLPITKKELTISGSRLQTNQFSEVVNGLNDGTISGAGLLTHTFKVDEVQEAFDFVEKNPNDVRKAVIVF